jgi:hypothetical protein
MRTIMARRIRRDARDPQAAVMGGTGQLRTGRRLAEGGRRSSADGAPPATDRRQRAAVPHAPPAAAISPTATLPVPSPNRRAGGPAAVKEVRETIRLTRRCSAPKRHATPPRVAATRVPRASIRGPRNQLSWRRLKVIRPTQSRVRTSAQPTALFPCTSLHHRHPVQAQNSCESEGESPRVLCVSCRQGDQSVWECPWVGAGRYARL